MAYAPTAVRFPDTQPRVNPTAQPAPATDRQPKRGTVYVLTNPSMPGQVKVGATERTAEHRRHELSRATGVAVEFEIAFEATFSDVWRAERTAHEHLAHYRVNGNREFFRCDPAVAIQVIRQLANLESHDRGAIEQLKKQGVAMLFGLDGEIRDLPRALELLGQASSMGSVWASYYAGRAAHELSREKERSPQARSNFRRTARTFYLDAKLEVPAAGGWLGQLYWDTKQWGDGNREWDAFVAAAAENPKPSKDALSLLLDYASFRVYYPNSSARPWRNAAVIAHTDALIALCGNRPDRERVKRVLRGENVEAPTDPRNRGRSAAPAPMSDRMAGKPAALRAVFAVLREPAGWVRDLCRWSPATALLIATAGGCYVLDHEGYAVLAAFGAATAALLRVAKTAKASNSRAPRWKKRYR
ncbi:GIY-YIG nuclease family protein [Burkholderia vietnamiensis]|uniref:GIY-YIG nuclease family protein n=1 Tax=Burkholderia vietnamiensis TaxID=60552 RepID=UPI001CF1A103|nr:GIY-YIG nuclease family protein [Burkholderia vietnamiensis]MCA8448846.1 GIY-YIG nuclease family protein [Burkholderia vietnamiensis]